MKKKLVLLVTSLVLLSACASAAEQPAKTQETVEEITEMAAENVTEVAVQEVLYHGGEPKTPEEALAQALTDADVEVPLCQNCATELTAVLTGSEELPVQQQDCISMVQGTDAVYKLSLEYEWKCSSCGYEDLGHTVEGTKAVVCHGWTS